MRHRQSPVLPRIHYARGRWALRRRRRIQPSALTGIWRPLLVTGCAAALVGTLLTSVDWSAGYRQLAGPGHGRGMSQHGAFDNAVQGWAAERILEHYYPGAALGGIGPTTLAVRLMAQDDSTLDTYAAAGARVAGRVLEPGEVAHLTALPDGGANVVVTAGCDGDVRWQTDTQDPWVYPLDPNPGRPGEEHLMLCNGTGYRGSLGLATEDGVARTVNRLDVEDYLLGVVPAEMQANWADKGASEALRAQAIAARSYALAETRYPYAQTCDTTDCQAYAGTVIEDPRAAEAVAATAGTVLLRDGRILRSEYSSAPDGGGPADIYTFEVGPTPAELGIGHIPEAMAPAAADLSVIDHEYQRLGGVSGTLGVPLGPELRLPRGAGDYRMFSNGVIVATPALGARVIDFAALLELAPEAIADRPADWTAPPRTASTPTPRPTANVPIPYGTSPQRPEAAEPSVPESEVPQEVSVESAEAEPESSLPE
ncbi:SpoIID/LytB domain-containing protein [Nocardia sp. NPDC050712]|uniref:SpoIID/LytB domain-containing protein n=1 Tax=Nocardia sp. NPDC050712 TaxID=3155518 RepID=UPI0033E87720